MVGPNASRNPYRLSATRLPYVTGYRKERFLPNAHVRSTPLRRIEQVRGEVLVVALNRALWRQEGAGVQQFPAVQGLVELAVDRLDQIAGSRIVTLLA